jgi:hypothetical protein
VDITTNDKQALTGIGRVQGAFSGLGSKLLALGGALGTGAFLYKAVTGASSLNETLDKTGIVFGKSAAQVIAQAEAMSKAFGLSRPQMLDAASVFGLMAKGAGLSQEEAAGFSNQLVKLAADAVSFYDVPMDVALEKIRSGLSGEAEPLRAFGVFLSDAAVKAEAARMGLGALGRELTEGEKILARQALITKQLADANGNLEQTAGSAANQMRKVAGQYQRIQEDIGLAILPGVVKGTKAATEGLDKMSTVLKENKSNLAGFSDNIGTGFSVLVGLIASAVDGILKLHQEYTKLLELTGRYDIGDPDKSRSKITQVSVADEQAAYEKEKSRRIQSERDAEWAANVVAQQKAMSNLGPKLAEGALAGNMPFMGLATGGELDKARDAMKAKIKGESMILRPEERPDKQASTTTLEGFAQRLMESGFAKDKSLAAAETTAAGVTKLVELGKQNNPMTAKDIFAMAAP